MKVFAVLLCAAVALVARPGEEAVDGVRGWWTARAYEQAAFESDWLQMGRLGRRLFAETGDPRPLQLAAYRFGLDGTARTQGQLDGEVLAWGGLFAGAMDELEATSWDPWTDAQLRAHVLVTRMAPVRGGEEDLERGIGYFERWLAAGGGNPRATEAVLLRYRELLRLPAPQKKVQILNMIDQ